jgi:hypothetical protein
MRVCVCVKERAHIDIQRTRSLWLVSSFYFVWDALETLKLVSEICKILSGRNMAVGPLHTR